MKIVFSSASRQDLRNISDYISGTLKNPIAAKNVIERILRSVKRLEEQPNMGVSLQEKCAVKTDYKCLFCENHIAFYKVQNETVKIIRILDGRTEYLKVIF